MTYRQMMKERLPQLREEGLSQKEAMKAVGREWQAYKKTRDSGSDSEANSAVVSSVSSPSPETPPKRKRGRPRKQAQERGVKESKLKGLNALKTLRLEVPYLVEAEPDVAAAWDVAEGIADYLMENARGLDEAESFQRRAAAAYMRAKGASSAGDQTEYDLGRSLGETLLLVLAHRRTSQADWQAMTPPQLVGADIVHIEGEDSGLISSGLEMLGLKDPESTSSKAVKKVKEKAVDTATDVVSQTVLDLLK